MAPKQDQQNFICRPLAKLLLLGKNCPTEQIIGRVSNTGQHPNDKRTTSLVQTDRNNGHGKPESPTLWRRQ